MQVSSHPESEWLARRQLIENLYSVKGWTMDKVRRHLCQNGFNVNTRMVKTRILNWNLHKKLSLIEARTALELIGPHRETWPCKEPSFRIRNKVVGLDRVLRSCQRRGIPNPFDWIQNTPMGGSRSPNVDLLPDPASEIFEYSVRESAPVLSRGPPDGQLVGAVDHTQESRTELSQSYDLPQWRAAGEEVSTDLVINRMRDPKVYILAAQAIREFQSYCLQYIACKETAIDHGEPSVHQFTIQGRLQNHVDEGVFYFGRNEMESAFACFRLALLLLEEMLEDVHPMSIAQYLMLLCRLTANKASGVAGKLLEQALNLTRIRKPLDQSLFQVLQAIHVSKDFLEMPLLCLRAAVDCMEESTQWQWKSLYVKERYCHALRLSGFPEEATHRRAKLFEEQQAYYGKSARNVLWTALVVAEDHVVQSRLQEAEQLYQCTLHRSEKLSGFYRAKVRAGALSGKAGIELARVRQDLDAQASCDLTPLDREVLLQRLESAEIFAREALDLAEKWFDREQTRRIASLRSLHHGIQAFSLQLGYQAEGASYAV